METIKLWARNGDAVRQAIELGELVHLETASEELTEALLLCASQSGLLAPWAEAFPAPRGEPESGLEGLLAAHLAARLAGRYARRTSGAVRRSASVLGALGERVAGLAPAQGLSLRGTSDATLSSGEGRRTLWVQLAQHVARTAPRRLPPLEASQAVTVRQRAARRAVQGAVDKVEAAARAQRVAAQLMEWENPQGGPSRLADARVGPDRRRPMVDTTHVEVPLEPGTYECSGVVKNDDGSRSRGYQWATLRP